LNPVAFPALRKFEVEVVQMTLNMLNAPSNACGTMTSGGTESLFCALKAYRERARVLFPHITVPEVVLPVSAHVAFPKGCALFDLKTVYVPMAADFGVDVAAFRKAITPNTILLVASAPQVYAFELIVTFLVS
jgi:sphinganine-1-phosphate aldolase